MSKLLDLTYGVVHPVHVVVMHRRGLAVNIAKQPRTSTLRRNFVVARS